MNWAAGSVGLTPEQELDEVAVDEPLACGYEGNRLLDRAGTQHRVMPRHGDEGAYDRLQLRAILGLVCLGELAEHPHRPNRLFRREPVGVIADGTDCRSVDDHVGVAQMYQQSFDYVGRRGAPLAPKALIHRFDAPRP